MEEIELYRIRGYFDQPGLHREEVIKYFSTKKQAQRAIKEERSQTSEDCKVHLWMDKVVLKDGKESFVKLLNKEVNSLSEKVNHFPPSEISDGTKEFGRVDYIPTLEVNHY